MGCLYGGESYARNGAAKLAGDVTGAAADATANVEDLGRRKVRNGNESGGERWKKRVEG